MKNSRASELVLDFLRQQVPDAAPSLKLRMNETFDSLAYLNFFLYLEQECSDKISLDEIVSCESFEEVVVLLSATTGSS